MESLPKFGSSLRVSIEEHVLILFIVLWLFQEFHTTHTFSFTFDISALSEMEAKLLAAALSARLPSLVQRATPCDPIVKDVASCIRKHVVQGLEAKADRR